jgi:tripartite-type tricarboxylate transporter receptor subunit TctC
VHSTPEEFAKYIASETAKWGKIARAAQVSMD